MITYTKLVANYCSHSNKSTSCTSDHGASELASWTRKEFQIRKELASWIREEFQVQEKVASWSGKELKYKKSQLVGPGRN
jgi:hypothetical protein